MTDLSRIGEELFNKIRGRFPSVTIGDESGAITNDPEEARHFNFKYQSENTVLGEVSISIDPKEGLTIIYSKDFIENQDDFTKEEWYNFLKEMRRFAKKRLLQFDVRDITKSNLNKRDYQFLANRSGDSNMNESTMYGTNRTSYQRIGNARLAIKHSAPINTESTSGRTQKIGNIFIESPDGERFKYPYRHLAGARAMARHVSEGGNAYDEFGQYISSLSEELSKLRKFNTYINRSGVMAETLSEYSGIVKERAATIRKEIQHLQKESFYREARDNFTAPIVEEVPEDVAENWIDQLTIKQFNEELKDVFPYIYKLVGEATRAEELGPEDLDEAGKLKGGAKDPCWSGYQMVGTKKKGGREVPNCVPRESMDLEEGLRPGRDFDLASKEYNGYVLGGVDDSDEDRYATMWGIYKALGDGTYKEVSSVKDPKYNGKYSVSSFTRTPPTEEFKWTVDNYLSKTPEEAELEAGFESMMGQFSEEEVDENLGKSMKKFKKWYGTDPRDVKDRINKADPEFRKKVADWPGKLGGAAELQRRLAKKVKDESDDTMDAQMAPEKPKTPLGEFILSYFDRETGKFPKGETAVLTAVEKDYGDQYVEPARQFIERVQSVTLEYKQQEAAQSRYPETEMIKTLAGL